MEFILIVGCLGILAMVINEIHIQILIRKRKAKGEKIGIWDFY